MLIFTLFLYLLFVVFQMLYIFIPLYSLNSMRNRNKLIPEKKITILVPAYNEQTVIIKSLLGLIHVDYQNYEVIFINDGSTDKTINLLNKHLNYIDLIGHHPRS